MRSQLFAFIIILVSFAGCEKKNKTADLNEVISSGTWRVGHFMNSNGDRTSDFLGYSFEFRETGSIMVLGNGVSHGMWMKDSGSDKILIDLGPDNTSNQPLGQLTNEWKIGNFSSTQISLSDESNASEMLVFLKN